MQFTLYSDTTDVQEALLRIDYTQQAFELVCSFFNGSRARGCYLVLNGTFGSYSKQVARENRSARHNHFVEGYLGELSYSVFDWEEDGTVGDIAIPVHVHEVVLPSKKPPEPTFLYLTRKWEAMNEPIGCCCVS